MLNLNKCSDTGRQQTASATPYAWRETEINNYAKARWMQGLIWFVIPGCVVIHTTPALWFVGIMTISSSVIAGRSNNSSCVVDTGTQQIELAVFRDFFHCRVWVSWPPGRNCYLRFAGAGIVSPIWIRAAPSFMLGDWFTSDNRGLQMSAMNDSSCYSLLTLDLTLWKSWGF